MRLSIRRLALGALQFLSIGGFLLASPSFSRAQSTTTSEVREHYNPAVLKLIYSIDPAGSADFDDPSVSTDAMRAAIRSWRLVQQS